jgi:hypothetical protein
VRIGQSYTFLHIRVFRLLRKVGLVFAKGRIVSAKAGYPFSGEISALWRNFIKAAGMVNGAQIGFRSDHYVVFKEDASPINKGADAVDENVFANS